MKLRIKGNALRLRLDADDLAELGATGFLEDAIHFAPGQELAYALRIVPELNTVTARFEDGVIQVALPRSLARPWLSSNEVSIKGEQEIGEGRVMKIRIEKDLDHGLPKPQAAPRMENPFYNSSDRYDEPAPERVGDEKEEPND